MPTTARGLRYPSPTDNPNIPLDLENLATDVDLMFITGTLAARPAAGKVGRKFLVTSGTSLNVLYLDTGTTWLVVGAAIPGTGFLIGDDVTLYRQAADRLQTDDLFSSRRATTSDYSFAALVTGEAAIRYQVRSDGRLEWGSGAAAVDTNLYRSAADTLKTDDSMHVGSTLRVDTAGTGSVIQFGAAADTNLYRSAANTLKTDDAFDALLEIRSATELIARLAGSAQAVVGAAGPASEAGLKLGSAGDTNLYRSAANVLRTSGTLDVLRDPAIDGMQSGVITGLSASSLDANTITAQAGHALVPADAGGALGAIRARSVTLAAQVNVTVPNATSARIDQIILRPSGSVERLAGTDSAGATLANRIGAATLPLDAIRLSDVQVSSTGITAVRDRRPWARGAFSRVIRSNQANLSTTSTTFVSISATLQVRMEVGELNNVRLRLTGSVNHTALSRIWFTFLRDGGLGSGIEFPIRATATNNEDGVGFEINQAQSAGSYLFAPAWRTEGGTAQLLTASGYVLEVVMQEIIVPTSTNGTT